MNEHEEPYPPYCASIQTDAYQARLKETFKSRWRVYWE